MGIPLPPDNAAFGRPLRLRDFSPPSQDPLTLASCIDGITSSGSALCLALVLDDRLRGDSAGSCSCSRPGVRLVALMAGWFARSGKTYAEDLFMSSTYSVLEEEVVGSYTSSSGSLSTTQDSPNWVLDWEFVGAARYWVMLAVQMNPNSISRSQSEDLHKVRV